MKEKTKSQLEESLGNIKPYLNNKDESYELSKMCENCEGYCGIKHDYSECEDKMCFKFFLAFNYLEWSNSFSN
jgi:hypothetical protein